MVDPTPTEASPSRPSVLSRAVALLSSFDEDAPRLSLSELAERTGLPTTTVHRMAGELVELGLLARDDSRRYHIGMRLWEFGELSWLSLHLREHALPHLLTLYESTGENVHMAVLNGFDALYIGRLIGPRSVPTVSRMGGRLPLHTTGVGKILLASEDDEFVEAYIRNGLATPTAYSIDSPARLRRDVAEIREQGWSFTSQEMTLGNVSIAVAVTDARDHVVAGLGLVTHLARGEVRRLVPMLRRAARSISAELPRL